MKQTIEKSLGSENVVIDINQLSSDDMQNALLLLQLMRQQKTGIFQTLWLGVQTIKIHQHLIIFKHNFSENTKTFMGYDDPNNAAAAQVGLKDYDALLDSAASETTDLNAFVTTVVLKLKSLVGR